MNLLAKQKDSQTSRADLWLLGGEEKWGREII